MMTVKDTNIYNLDITNHIDNEIKYFLSRLLDEDSSDTNAAFFPWSNDFDRYV